VTLVPGSGDLRPDGSSDTVHTSGGNTMYYYRANFKWVKITGQ